MKLTCIWQSPAFMERDWINDIFSSVTGEHVVDGNHRIVADHCLVIDSYLHSRPREYYAQFRGMNAWLLHFSDETYEGGYDVYDDFCGVFRNYSASIFNPRRVLQFPLGYTNGIAPVTDESGARTRPYLWSFLGAARRGSRPEMIKALLPLQPQFLLRTDLKNVQPIGKQQYRRILLDSTFVPCPMGNVSLETFRVYEALECGAIPILERRVSLDYFAKLLGPHPLPTFSNWNQASRFISAIRDDRQALDNLHKLSFEWWIDYKQRLRERIPNFLASAPGIEAGPFISRTYSLPGWQQVELLRHHTLPAFGRRVALQVNRLLKKGKLRETTGA
jgi:hypothetical protein